MSCSDSLQVSPELAGVAILAVVAGDDHVCALTAEGGRVECFGTSRADHSSLEVPPGLAGVVSLSAAGRHTCAVTATVGLVCWGSWGGRVSYEEDDYEDYYEDCDSREETWSSQVTVPISLSQGVAAVACGLYHTCALNGTGEVLCFGPNNSYGQQNVPWSLSGQMQAVVAGAYHSCALTTNGSVTCWGGNDKGQLDVPQGLAGVVALAAGLVHTCALKGEGTVVCWGGNGAGQCNAPPELSGVQALFAGWYSSAALRADGQVVRWGV